MAENRKRDRQGGTGGCAGGYPPIDSYAFLSDA